MHLSKAHVPGHARIHTYIYIIMYVCAYVSTYVPYIANAMDIIVLLWAIYCLLCLSLEGRSV